MTYDDDAYDDDVYDDDPHWYMHRRAARPREVVGGIKAKSRRGDIGDTWWSRRFLDVIDRSDTGARLARGRSYARRGQVVEMSVSRGEIRAEVQGSRREPYVVRIGIAPLSDVQWKLAQWAMAKRAVFVAKLLAGDMPHEIEEAFADGEGSLFPRTPGAITSRCSCPDDWNPCKHAAAVFYLFAEALDEDPFLAFAWRGRTREDILGALRERRGDPKAVQPSEVVELPSLEGGRLSDHLDDFWDAGPLLESVVVHPVKAEAPASVLAQFGSVGVRVGDRDLSELLASLYEGICVRIADEATQPDGP